MYVIAALRETLPHYDFVKFAGSQKTKMPSDFRPLPESPIYCRPSGYRTVSQVVEPGSKIYEALETVRQLTAAFTVEHGGHSNKPRGASQSPEGAALHTDVDDLINEVFAMPACADLDFETMKQRYMYEAIRLTSRIYAHALANRISFSEAAQQIQPPLDGALPLHIEIRNALIKTDMTDCWGHMAGVLFWLGVIAGAAANPAASPAGYISRRETGDEEDARKYLAATVVRCSILMGFEYGPAIMETMKRIIGIQTVLHQGKAQEVVEPSGAGMQGLPATTIGVSMPPPTEQAQRGFADFAQDFLTS
jgi:hypothetical protein